MMLVARAFAPRRGAAVARRGRGHQFQLLGGAGSTFLRVQRSTLSSAAVPPPPPPPTTTGTRSSLGEKAAGCSGFSELGLFGPVSKCLDAKFPAGPLPFQVQAMPIVQDSLLQALETFKRNSGRDMGKSTSYGDVVLCSETGSGKTISYAAPLLSVLAEHTSSFESKDAALSAGSQHNEGGGKKLQLRRSASALILCPNMVLVHQAKAAICDVFGENVDASVVGPRFGGRPLVEVIDGSAAPLIDSEQYNHEVPGSAEHALCDDNDLDRSSPPKPLCSSPKTNSPIFYLGTPAGIVRHLRTYLDRGRQRHFVQNISSVVLDEADMLLSAYETEMRDFFTFLVYGSAHEQGASMYAKKDLAKFLARNRGRMHAPQLVCAGATLPTGALKAPGAVLRKALQRAVWVDSQNKHQAVNRTSFFWACVNGSTQSEGGGGGGGGGVPAEDEPQVLFERSDIDTRLRPLIGAILDHHGVEAEPNVATAVQEHAHSEEQQSPISCLVFCRSLKAAHQLTKSLVDFEHSQIKLGRPTFVVSEFHRDVPLEERLQTLEDWSKGATTLVQNRVMVCTDAAARGLDLPDVDAVIHADFAASAIDFLHRSGRTGRARQNGTVVSLYTDKEVPLVEKIREAIESGGTQTLEETFSRRRSFRKKHKRHLKEKATFQRQGDDFYDN